MQSNVLVIGLTGNIATGKSTILDYLTTKGAYIIDADKLAHQAFAPDGPAYQAVVDTFGPSVVSADGTVDRQALAEIVFSDPGQLGRLEQIVHPAVFEMVLRLVDESPSGVVILEAVKLLEAGTMASECDEIWVVTTSPSAQFQRLKERRGMDEQTARRRMQMQSPQAAKVNQADRVIDNSGTLDELYVQLDRIWADLKEMYPKRTARLADHSQAA